MTARAEESADYLRRLGEAGDGPHDIAAAALMLSALDHPETPLDSYREHLAELAQAMRAQSHFVRDAEALARALAAVMVQRYGYDGDRLAYGDAQNADLIAVIERRRGLPVALGILYIHAARGAGLAAHGLLAPGHFLLALETKDGDALIDPFNGGAALEREKLSAPPSMAGLGMPDDPRVLEPVSDTDVLLRLLNNVKARALERRETMRELEIARRMVLIAPRRAELWYELGQISERSGALGAAARAYEGGLALAKPGAALHNEAALALSALKRKLN